MAVFRRSPAGKNGGNGTAGIPELHTDLFPVREKIGQKIVIVDDLPPQSIYEKEYFDGFMFHIDLMATPGIRGGAGNRERVYGFSVFAREGRAFL